MKDYTKEIIEKKIWQFIYKEIIVWGFCGIENYNYNGKPNSLEGVKAILEESGLEIDTNILELKVIDGYEELMGKEELTPFEEELFRHIKRKEHLMLIVSEQVNIYTNGLEKKNNIYKCIIGGLVGVVCGLIYMLVR